MPCLKITSRDLLTSLSSLLRCGVVRLLLRRSLEDLRPTHTHYQFTGKYTSLHLTRVVFFGGIGHPFLQIPRYPLGNRECVCYAWNFSTPPFICHLIFQGKRCFIQHGGIYKGLQLSKREQVESYKALQSVVGTWASWPNCSRLFTALPCLVPFHFHSKWFRLT